MPRLVVKVEKNAFPGLATALPSVIDRATREQVLATQGDVVLNMAKYNYWETGTASGSVEADTTAMEVSVNAESEDGYPYPTVGNYGSVHQAPRPFFSDAEETARQEFPKRMKRHVDGAVGP